MIRRDKLSILGNRVSRTAEALHSLFRLAETAPTEAMPDVLAVASALTEVLELTGGEIASRAVEVGDGQTS